MTPHYSLVALIALIALVAQTALAAYHAGLWAYPICGLTILYGALMYRAGTHDQN